MRGYSQERLARACRLSQSTISSYENGSRKSPSDMVCLAQALDVDVFWLSTGEGSMDGPARTPAPRTTTAGAGTAPATAEKSPATPVLMTQATAISMTEMTWPFPTIDSRKFWSLSAKDRQAVEAAVSALIDALRTSDSAQKS